MDPSLLAGLARTFGTKDLDSICRLMSQLLPTNPRFDKDHPETWNSLLAMLHDIAPKDPLEGILAVQMVGVHQAAMEFLGRAMAPNGIMQSTDANVSRANKLLTDAACSAVPVGRANACAGAATPKSRALETDATRLNRHLHGVLSRDASCRKLTRISHQQR